MLKKSGKAHLRNESEWMDAKQWHKTSQRRASVILVYRYKPSVQRDEPIMAALQSAVARYNLWI